MYTLAQVGYLHFYWPEIVSCAQGLPLVHYQYLTYVGIYDLQPQRSRLGRSFHKADAKLIKRPLYWAQEGQLLR